MGATLKSQGKYDEAISAYMKALAVNPDYFTHYNWELYCKSKAS